MSSEKSLASDEDPFAENDVDNEPQDGQASRPSKRRANLYDAIAGRVNPRGVKAIRPVASQYRDTASSGARALRPEELLCRRQNFATQPIDEKTYFAHEELPSDQPLPGSELLEAMPSLSKPKCSAHWSGRGTEGIVFILPASLGMFVPDAAISERLPPWWGS